MDREDDGSVNARNKLHSSSTHLNGNGIGNGLKHQALPSSARAWQISHLLTVRLGRLADNCPNRSSRSSVVRALERQRTLILDLLRMAMSI